MNRILLHVAGALATLVCTVFTSMAQTTPQTRENNQVCMDPIVGAARGPFINTARTSGLCVGCGGSSASAIVDGNLNNVATIDLGVSAAGGFRISVKDSLQYYPGGNEVGFVVRNRTNGLLGLLDASLLNQFVIRTYRTGNPNPVETASFSSGTGVLKAAVLGGSGDGRQVLSFVTSQDFDEVELAYTGAVTAGRLVDVFYAFEGPANCPKDCANAILSAGESATVTTGSISPLPLGASCVLGSLSGEANLIDADSTTNFATITSTVGLACTRYIEVRSNTTYPAGYEAGFLVDNGDGIIGLNLLGGVTITTYRNGTVSESFSGTGLVGASVLGATSRVQLGFKAAQPFNSIRISLTGISVAVNLRVFHAYVKADTDSDGIADCMDKCATGSDLLDADGDGTPDGCDQNVADISVSKTVSSATATVGSSVTFTVSATRTAQFNATGLVIRDTLARGFTYVSHTASPGTVYDPVTGRWTIGSALAGPATSVNLAIAVTVDSVGVTSNVAEVIRSFESDPDSSPGNGNFAEDDIASSCVSVPVRICEGASLQLSAPASYTTGVEWFRTIDNVTTSVATTPTFSASLSGSYSFTATGMSGCVSGNCCPVIIIVDPAPVPVIIASSSTICAGTSATLTVSNAAPGITYVWSNGTTGPTLEVTPRTTTVYSVSATTTAGGCSGVSTFTIVVNQPPVQAPIVALCGPTGNTGYSFSINPTTTGSTTTYFVKVGDAPEAGPYEYGVARTFDNNTGNLSVVIRDAQTNCSILLPVVAPANCQTCPPKVCVPIRIARTQ
ncbi:Ig-like domain-containing protein [Spirosoma sordidisoli]|uniref:DUF11 domain-containing protein n=1 Tax=Spirosoma sordidisoli TaxID=2502893 RepID=A0A4Q2UNM8_9BACT|nr:DUF11 domain-containing protein [Spirosoma sordidisoli]RYC69200.1 DUF11 domain-containing protein [Spirosoma sordidisoli]